VNLVHFWDTIGHVTDDLAAMWDPLLTSGRVAHVECEIIGLYTTQHHVVLGCKEKEL